MNRTFKWLLIDTSILIIYFIISTLLILGAFSWGERDGSGFLVIIMFFPYLITVLGISSLLILLNTTKVKMKMKILNWLNALMFLPLLGFLCYYSFRSGERIGWVILIILFPALTSYLYLPLIRKINMLISEKHRLEIDG